MICKKCNFSNKADSKFCENCGNLLSVTCPKCGKNFSLDTKFCDIDGTNLQGNYSQNDNFTEPMPETYQGLSIVVFILCIVPLGLILTLPEIFNASKVKRLYESGDIEDAKRLSRRIKNGLIWSVVCTVVFWIIVVISLNN